MRKCGPVNDIDEIPRNKGRGFEGDSAKINRRIKSQGLVQTSIMEYAFSFHFVRSSHLKLVAEEASYTIWYLFQLGGRGNKYPEIRNHL